jgi:hypothetical protein
MADTPTPRWVGTKNTNDGIPEDAIRSLSHMPFVVIVGGPDGSFDIASNVPACYLYVMKDSLNEYLNDVSETN